MVRFFKQVMFWSFIAGLIYGGFEVGRNLPKPESAEAAPRIVEVSKDAPILQRICSCESEGNPNGKGIQTKNGKLVTNRNSDGSDDVGACQINVKYWGLEAMQMDLNLTEEKDNRAMAKYIYENYGTDPWNASKSCWKR